MKVKKTVASLITALLLTVISLLSFAGCKQEEPTYDVAIKVANNYGMEWVFEPDLVDWDGRIVFNWPYSERCRDPCGNKLFLGRTIYGK